MNRSATLPVGSKIGAVASSGTVVAIGTGMGTVAGAAAGECAVTQRAQSGDEAGCTWTSWTVAPINRNMTSNRTRILMGAERCTCPKSSTLRRTLAVNFVLQSGL